MKGLFGIPEARRLWYLEFIAKAKQAGAFQVPWCPCMLFVRDTAGLLVGLLCSHVDDVLMAGSGAHYEEFKWRLFKKLRLKEASHNIFKCPKRKIERRPGGAILVSFEHLGNIKPIYITRKIRRQPNDRLTLDETSSLRSLIGELGWPTREGFPEFCYDVSDLQQRVPEATVSTMIRANSVLRDLQQRARKPALRYVRGDGSGRITVGLYNDASFDRHPRGGSQQGYIIVIGGKELAIKDEFYASPVAWSSTRIHRVVRSTLAAEAAALATGYDTAVYIRAILCFLLADWSGDWMADVAQIPQVTWTDCRSLLRFPPHGGLHAKREEDRVGHLRRAGIPGERLRRARVVQR